jgi:hypothetical protein
MSQALARLKYLSDILFYGLNKKPNKNAGLRYLGNKGIIALIHQ